MCLYFCYITQLYEYVFVIELVRRNGKEIRCIHIRFNSRGRSSATSTVPYKPSSSILYNVMLKNEQKK